MGRPPLSPGPIRRPHPVLAGGQIQARKTTLPGGSRRDDPRKSTGQLQFRAEYFLLEDRALHFLLQCYVFPLATDFLSLGIL